MMIVEIIMGFVAELLRALLVEELSRRVRSNARRVRLVRQANRHRRFYTNLHRDRQRKLLHKLVTDQGDMVS